MSSFEIAVKKQHEILYRISRAVENLKKLGKDKWTRFALDARIQSLDANWDQFQSSHRSLIAVQIDELRSHDYFSNDLYADCEELYLDAKAEMIQIRDRVVKMSADENDSTGDLKRRGGSLPGTARALPKISLPKFAGEYHTWPPFRDLFVSMVGANPDIPSVEKLHYLKSHLSGDAARLLSNLPVTANNYSRAWDVLCARYENKRVLASSYLDQLFALPTLINKSASDLKELLATVKESLGGLRALGAPVESWDLFLVYFVARRLDDNSRETWELEQEGSTKLPAFRQIEEFLESRIRAFEMIGLRAAEKSTRPQKTTKPPKSQARAHAATSPAQSCALCTGPHYIAACSDFASKTVDGRREVVIAKKLCYNCLGLHRLSDCRSSKRRVCSGQHHTLIHRPSSPSPVAASSGSADGSAATSSSASSTQPVLSMHSAPETGGTPQALLATARVRIVSAVGHTVDARTLLDKGSELSFVRESLAQSLALPRRRATIPVVGIGSQPAGSTRGMITLRLRSRLESDFERDVSAYILPRLTGHLPASPLPTASWTHIDGLALADPDFATPGKIELILGADVYGELLRGSIRKGSADQPVAQHTILGWIISGPVFACAPSTPESTSLGSFSGGLDYDLHELVSRFWAQEDVSPAIASALSKGEKQCEDHFVTTHSRSASGRYTVRLPFRSNPPNLGDSYLAASRMLYRMRSRFRDDAELRQLYCDFMHEYELLGHMRRVPPCPVRARNTCFLPHHGVLRKGLATSKLRVVFNGSLRTANGKSLNDHLHVGPKLQHDIADMILRWRCYAFVFLADIEKMYRQIIVHHENRDFQRILWGLTDVPDEFHLCTVTYGLACAPFLALRVIKQLADDEEHRYPAAATTLRENMYVDDVLSGADTLKLAQAKAAQTDQILMAGGFRLHK